MNDTTLWSDSYLVCQGFHRETGEVAKPGVQHVEAMYVEPEEFTPSKDCTNRGFTHKTITSASDYSSFFQASVGASVEGWGGVSAEASAQFLNATQMSSNSLVGALTFKYDGARRLLTPAVTVLKPDAATYLQENGPAEFHREYGSHFIAGYRWGGSFTGYVTSSFESTQQATEAKAAFSASFSNLAMKMSGSGEFEKSMQSKSGYSKTIAGYTTKGYSRKPVDGKDTRGPEQVACGTVEQFADIINNFNVEKGNPTEAILARYSDCDGYTTALSVWQLKNKATPHAGFYNDIALSEKDWAAVVASLNMEYGKILYLEQQVSCYQSSTIKELATKITAAKNRFTNFLGGSIDEVRDTYRALFLTLTDSLLPDNGGSGEKDTKKQELHAMGMTKWRELRVADSLQKEYDALVQQGPPHGANSYVILGNGWEMGGGGDGWFRILYNGEPKFAIQPDHAEFVPHRFEEKVLKHDDVITLENRGRYLSHRDPADVANFAVSEVGAWEKLRVRHA